MSTSLMPWVRRTRALRPDVALDFQGLLRSALIGRFSGAREFYGMSDAREGARFFYDHVAPVDRQAHAVERYLQLAAKFGAPIQRPPFVPLPTGDPVPRFDESVPFVLLHPFARGQRKSLSDLVIDEFCRVLSPSRVVLVGLSNRTFPVRENCVSLINQTTLLQLIWLIRAARFTVSVDSGPMHIASALSERLVSLVNQTDLAELIWLLRQASFIVSVDSGPMHIGAAVTPELLSIHTWSDPRRVGPYNPDAWIWKGGDLLRVRELQSAPKRHRSKRAFKMSDVDKLMPLLREHLGRSP